jgi:hypothetical protein
MALGATPGPRVNFGKKNTEILCAKLNLFRLAREGAKSQAKTDSRRRLSLAPVPKFGCSTRQFHTHIIRRKSLRRLNSFVNAAD